ncbi:hypothetical protein HMI54_015276, partial [Coelomomyces lativittatus]
MNSSSSCSSESEQQATSTDFPSSLSCPVDHSQWNQTTSPSHPFFHTSTTSSNPPSSTPPVSVLSAQRAKSSIPKHEKTSASLPSSLSNETNTHWMYPSEEMFYKAMVRKKWDPKREDMKVIVPIHNAVNEMAWQQILKWESFSN